MKTKPFLNVRKLDRNELKNLKGGDINIGKVCCTATEDGQCCEWVKDPYSCQYIYC